MILRASLVAALLLPTAAPAQDLERPAGWVVRPDDSAADADTTLRFVAMPPGWHVTTGPPVILYDPAATAAGSFRVEAETYRFPGDSAAGFGLFMGGRGLEGPELDYVAFLVDRDGRFELHHRGGAEIHSIAERTAHPAIVPWTGGTAKNVLSAEVRPDSVRFLVNGEEVAAYERQSYMDFDGIVGLRVGGGINLHVTRLDVTRLEESGEGATPRPESR